VVRKIFSLPEADVKWLSRRAKRSGVSTAAVVRWLISRARRTGT
jgi:hypothetical protein